MKENNGNIVPEPTGVDALIASLGSEGAVDSEGRFTLDRERAREKLQRFQLEDPHRFVLELIRSAVQRGAVRIEIWLDADDLCLHFDGEAYTRSDFDQLWNALIDENRDVEKRSLGSLALGVNAALALPLAFVHVLSGDEDEGAKLLVRPKLPDEYGEKSVRDEPAIAPSRGFKPTTTIHVRRRGGVGSLARALTRSVTSLPEERLIREACRFARAQITLNGESITPNLPKGGLGVASLESKTCRVMAWHSGEASETAQVHLVAHDVLVCTERLVGLPAHFEAAVQRDDYELDLSRTAVVKNEAHKGARDAAEAAWEPAIATLCVECANTWVQATKAPDWALQTLRSAFRARFTTREAGEDPAGPELLHALRGACLWHVGKAEPEGPSSVVLRSDGSPVHFGKLAGELLQDLQGCADAETLRKPVFALTRNLKAYAQALIVEDQRDRLHLEGLLGAAARRIPTSDSSYYAGPHASLHQDEKPEQVAVRRIAILLAIIFVSFVGIILSVTGYCGR